MLNKNKEKKTLTRKLEEKMTGMSMYTILTIYTIVSIVRVITGTYCTWEESKLPDSIINGYLPNQLTIVSIANIILTILLGLYLIYKDAFQASMYGHYYSEIQKKQFKTDIKDLMNTNIGQLNHTITNYVNYKIKLFDLIVNICTRFIPFILIIKKLYDIIGIVPVFVNIFIIITTIGLSFIVDSKEKINKIKNAARICNGISTDNLMNIRTLRYLHKSAFSLNRLNKYQREYEIENIALWRNFGMALLYCAPFVATIYNVYILKNCRDINILVFICSQTFGTLANITDLTIEFIKLLRKYNQTKNDLKFLDNKSNRNEKPISDEGIKIRNCVFGYPDSDILFECNMTLEKGKRYSLTGISGQGKSTLANLIVGNISPIKGKVDEVRTFYIHQDTEILDSSLKDNLVFDRDDISEDFLKELLYKVGLQKWFDEELKEGFNSILGDRGTKVSLGQRQRINIIRAIIEMTNKDINNTLIILDEPTSNLDNETEKLVVDLIDEYCKNTLLVITHRPAIENICDYHYKVENHKFFKIS